ncbi:cytochrome P450 726A27 [Ricinus communis]|uniref:Cytochrome P450, putative n=1 Tax=Ricinus communis TaxID=3988 RepID=B9T233_RICCO|nr:cytochrome P450 726A27 [Ricinus communis]EEF30086.1 cytochrome P450, putative [Ricinus communis]|eukprot:XP_002532302.1 premnaspirodiene oxygenase [Ricinus communis]
MELQIFSFPVLLSFFLFIFMVLRIWKNSNKKLNPPPGPWKLPLLGNIHQLATPLPHQRLRDLAKSFGPVMSIKLGEISAVIISSAEAAQEVLKSQDVTFAERPASLASKLVLYNRNDIVFGAYGPQWRQTRKLCVLELLSAKRIQSFKSVREEEVDEFAKFVYSKGGTPVNLTDKLFALTNTIMARTTIGKKCRSEKDLLRCIDGIFEEAGVFNLADAFPSFTLLPVITGAKFRLEKLHRETDKILEDILREHIASKAASDKDTRNLLHVLLDLQESGNLEVPITNDSIKATILDIFIAGSDTSAKTVEWAMSELMRNPKLMKRAQEEVRQVFGEKGFVDEAGLQDLKFMKLIVKETLRLHPVFAMFPRECREKTKVNGYDISPKTTMLINVWAIGRDPNVWPDAEKFNPERFLDSSIDYKGNNAEMIPFGAGKRICLGMTLGTLILEHFLAKLLYHFDWKFPDGVTPENFDMTEHYSASMRRETDLILIPIPVHPLPTH